MYLVDTSVWIDHFRSGHPYLANLLERNEVCTHAFVIGEIACGYLRNREVILDSLAYLPALQTVSSSEILHFIRIRKLAGRGLGLVDMHLLAASLLEKVELLSEDRRLRKIYEELI